MTLMNPLALYLFSLAGVVIAAYFLLHRARPYQVSALFLWQRAEERGARTLRFARRPPWLLLLQLLALSLLVLALGNPVYFMAGVPGKLAILIDGSASMLTAQGGKTRYELAVEEALELINSAAGEVTVVQAKHRPRVLVPLTQDKNGAKALLRSSRPAIEGDALLKELWALLKGQAPLPQFQRIVYITDHPLEVEGVEGPPLETVLVGGEARNLGLTAFTVRREPDPTRGYSIFVRAENYTDREEHPMITITADGEEVFSQKIALPARGARALAFSYPPPLPTRFTATLEVEDDFPWDDRRYFALQRSQRRVLWLGREDRFLRGALLAAHDFVIEREAGAREGRGRYDLIVANGIEVPAELEGSILLVNSSYPPLLRLLGPEEVQGPIEASGHPLLAGVEVSDILVAKANRVALPPGGEVLLSADGLPLLYLKQGKDRKICYLGFDLRWSNIVLTVDFPILIKRMLTWLLPPEAGLSLETGEPLLLRGAVEVTGPRGRTYHLEPGEPLIAELPGFYRLDDGRTVRYLAANLPPEEPAVGLRAEAGRGRAHHEGGPLGSWPRPLWGYLALGGLLALALELWCYDYDRTPFRRRKR